MNCLQCGVGKLKPTTSSEIPGEFRDFKTTVTMPALECSNCGYVTIRGEDMATFMTLVSDKFREQAGLLTSKEIRDRRAGLKLTQEAFAGYLGVGVASIKRWELGQVQDEAMDQLIRLKTNPDEAMRNYCEVASRVGVLPIDRFHSEPIL